MYRLLGKPAPLCAFGLIQLHVEVSEICSMTEKVGKRARKANFSAEEIRILLEELQVEHVTLFSSPRGHHNQ